MYRRRFKLVDGKSHHMTALVLWVSGAVAEMAVAGRDPAKIDARGALGDAIAP